MMTSDFYFLTSSESVLQQRVLDLEGAQTIRGGTSPFAEVRRLRKERDDLKEAVNNIETELMQVCTCVCICISGLHAKFGT